MAYQIQVCTPSDAEALANNNVSAFWEDPTWRLVWTRPGHAEIPKEELIKAAGLRMRNNLAMDRDLRRHVKAVDDKGNLVGYARWLLPGEKWKDAWPEMKGPEPSEEERREWEGMAERAAGVWMPREDMGDVDEPVVEVLGELMGRGEYLNLDYLAVHPDHKGKGIATLLVQHGVEAAERLGLDAFVLAFEAGLGIYKRNGFKLLRQLTLNDAVYGGKGDFTRYYLERKTGM
ncbi:hypothetical protein OQA88_4848 [Cercophora sp. LCS_1]